MRSNSRESCNYVSRKLAEMRFNEKHVSLGGVPPSSIFLSFRRRTRSPYYDPSVFAFTVRCAGGCFRVTMFNYLPSVRVGIDKGKARHREEGGWLHRGVGRPEPLVEKYFPRGHFECHRHKPFRAATERRGL